MVKLVVPNDQIGRGPRIHLHAPARVVVDVIPFNRTVVTEPPINAVVPKSHDVLSDLVVNLTVTDHDICRITWVANAVAHKEPAVVPSFHIQILKNPIMGTVIYVKPRLTWPVNAVKHKPINDDIGRVGRSCTIDSSSGRSR